jgi:hypothetical protein
MMADGVNIRVISQSMGHANIGITLDTYSHLLLGMGKTAEERFEKLLEPWLGDENVGNGERFRCAPRGIRTHDPRFRRPMLCPLSYRRMPYFVAKIALRAIDITIATPLLLTFC